MRPFLGLVLLVALVSGLALDSNNISSNRSSKKNAPNGDNGNTSRSSRRGSGRNPSPPCEGPDCEEPVRSCSNRAQRRQSSRGRQDLDVDQDRDFNQTRAVEMSRCVRSSDCAPGLCCARYLTTRRCQRVPAEGEVCLLLRGSSKRRRGSNLGRCQCGAGLTCEAGPGAGHVKGQGVCRVQTGGLRKTRHSGKKRRTAEASC